MFYKKITFLLCMFLSAFLLHANNADIKAFIETNSDVKVEVQNDSKYPWTFDGTKLKASADSWEDASILTITYESDSMTTIKIEAYACGVSIDGLGQGYDSINVAKGKHTIEIRGSHSSYISSLFISVLNNALNNAKIKAFIETNSDVKVEVQNNSEYPWTFDGTKLVLPSESSGSDLTITYESDSMTTIKIEGYLYDVIIDDITYNYGDFLPSMHKGKHTIKIRGYHGNCISSLFISYDTITMLNNAKIKAFIETNSDVKVEVQYNSKYPWTFDGTKLVPPSESSTSDLTITYESDSMTTIKIEGYDYYVIIDDITYDYRDFLPSMHKGKHTIKIRGKSDYISCLSIKNYDDADIKALFEANLNVEVKVENDALIPCYLTDTNSITFPKGSKLSIKYSSNKITKFSYNGGPEYYRDTISIDGKKYSLRASDVYCTPTKREHEIIFTANKEKGFRLSNISLIEIDSMQAIEQKNMPHNTSSTSGYNPYNPKEIYDYDGDGYFECLEYKYDPILCRWDKGFNMYISEWINLNNDDYMDGVQTKYNSYVSISDSLYNMTMLHNSELTFFDYNNDGYPNFKRRSIRINNAYTFRDSGYTTSNLKLMSFNEYNNNLIKKKYKVGLLASKDALDFGANMIVDPSMEARKKQASSSDRFFDINGDGIPDHISDYDKKIIINLGNGEGIYYDLSGEMTDLNADGKMDFIGFDGQNIICYLMQNDGTFMKKELCQTGVIHDELFCYDFDKDGDKDILLAFKWKQSWQGAYLFMLENKGNFEYYTHEYFYDKSFTSDPQCIDFDNDGYYELIWEEKLAMNENNGSNGKYKVCYIDINGMNIAETPIYFDIPIGDRNNRYFVLDIDNDGIMDLFTDSYRVLLSSISNAKPNKPNVPRLTYEENSGILSINWDLGIDKESSSIDLTYALRIGTEPGKGDILYAHAKPDGTRRNVSGGNHSTNRYRIINTNTWKTGKYYISVQVVDPNNRGSEFSEEVVFEKTSNAAAFELMYNVESFGIGDTCNIILHPNVLKDTTYHVVCTNGRIVAVSEDNLTLQVVFTESGEQKISLCTKNNNGESIVTCYKNIEVTPFSATKNEGKNLFAMDLDEDGYMEFFRTDAFYTYDSLGNYSRINKMFNNNTILSDLSDGGYTIDLNKDGKCDVINKKHQKFFRIFNNGNKNMTIDPEYILFGGNFEDLRDLNNDGWFDIITYSNIGDIAISSSGYDSFEILDLEIGGSWDKDFTNDGLVDVAQYNGGVSYIYENNGDFTVTPIDTLLSPLRKNFHFDGDKKLDYLLRSGNNDTAKIVWGNGSETIFDQSINIGSNPYLFDYNNDGYFDITGSRMVGDREENGVILILPNLKYQFVRYDLSSNYGGSNTFIISDSIIQCGSYLLKLKKNNSRPTAPTNLSAGYTDKGVMITWDHSIDAETPTGHMRYNISVKHKGKTGEGSYFISPCNSTTNGVHVPSALPLIESNRFLIPTSSIPVGEYEVQVQGVDLLGLESNFSEIYDLVVSENIVIKAPSVTGVSVETTISIASNVAGNIDWDGGKVISSENGKYVVVWDTIGVKNITVGQNMQQISVRDLPNAEFILPTEVMMLATVNGIATNPHEGEWTISTDNETFILFSKSNLVEMLSTDTTSIALRFNNAGQYTIRHTISSYYGIGTYEQTITVNEEHIMPEISTVTNVNGYYQISWENSNDMPANVIGYKIYKETSYADVYELLHETDLNTNSYMDLATNPNVQSERYVISYVTSYGESQKSKPHQGIHVMINKGVGNSWNLAWFQYEGRDVASYRIWRGTTPDQLYVIGEISGNMTSFSDLKTNDSVCYYAVEVVFKNEIAPQTQVVRYSSAKTKAKTNISSMSNIVSTEMAYEVNFTESIIIKGNDIVIGENNTTQLTAYIHPYNATYKSVNWVVEEGAKLAQIDANGLLSIISDTIDNKDIVVRAYALDGSNVSAEKTIHISNPNRLYTITYIVEGEVYHIDSFKVEEYIGNPYLYPDKVGYKFIEWVGLPEYMPANNIVVEAKFELDEEFLYCIYTYGNAGDVSGGGYYHYNTELTITATPYEGYHFVRWSDGSTENPRTIIVTEDRDFIAEFAMNVYTVTLNAENGTVIGAGEYKHGNVATIQATPNEGYYFVKWSDGVTNATRKIMLTSDTTLTAEFSNIYTIKLKTKNGTVTGAGEYEYGTEVTLTATPDEGYHFVQWSDGSDEATRTIKVTEDINLTAKFAINIYTVKLTAKNGIVTGAGEYKHGTEATFTATPYEGYHFVKWSDGVTDATRTITITSDLTLSAEFVINIYVVTLSANNGIVTGAGEYEYGTDVIITAEPNDGYEFIQWSDGDKNNIRTITVTNNITLSAEFAPVVGVDNITNSKFIVYTQNQTLYVEGIESEYYILDITGKVIYYGLSTEVALPCGVYMVTTNGEYQKVIIK